MKTVICNTNILLKKFSLAYFCIFFIGIVVVFSACRQEKNNKPFKTGKERNKPEINILQDEFRQIISDDFTEREKDSMIKIFSEKYYMNILVKHIDKDNETEYSHDKLQEYLLYLKFFSQNKTPHISSINIDSLYETTDSIIVQVNENFISTR